MDTLFAPIYDEHWGSAIDPTHRSMVVKLLSLCPPRPRVLDAACGTGKYWPLLLGSGCSILGTDQSAGMLTRASEKLPDVPVRKVGLQELDYEGEFDAVICVDAMENVFPEDWPLVLSNFRRALVPGGYLYLTVELAEDEELAAAYEAGVRMGLPLVEGEHPFVFDPREEEPVEGGYHYYPAIPRVREWTREAGFEIVEEAEGDGYHHLIARSF